MSYELLVLAAGLGSRYGGAKQLERVGPGGETLMDYALWDAAAAGVRRAVFVIRREHERVFRQEITRRYLSRLEVDFAFQELTDLPEGFAAPSDRLKPWGTGHAVWAARHLLRGPFATINAEVYAGPTSALMFRSVGDCLKEALKRGVITADDLFGDDLSVVAKLKAGIGDDETLARHWKRMHKITQAIPDERDPHVRVTCKSRVVDPRVGDASTRLSAVDPAWATLVKREQTPKRYAFRYAD